MSRNPSNVTLIVAIALASAVMLPLRAGDWHRRTSAGCSDCHTQHNSEAGQPMRTDNVMDPSANLLRRATALDLCVSCHDGSSPSAPDVIDPVSYVGESAAGSFPNTSGIPTGNAHHLNSATAEVPPGGTKPMVLTCTTCHDPHGNDNYRNLRPDPTFSNPPDIIIQTTQTISADGGNPEKVYVSSNIIYKSGVSAWCGKCHGTLGTDDHPVDRALFGAAHASYTAWLSTTLARVPVHSPADVAIPSTDDQVMCLSCHKAHGSANPNSLIHADGAALDSTCQECHDK